MLVTRCLRLAFSEQGELRECTFGHGARQTIELEALADIVDPVYRRYHEEGGSVLVPLTEEIGDHNHQQLGDGPEVLLGDARIRA